MMYRTNQSARQRPDSSSSDDLQEFRIRNSSWIAHQQNVDGVLHNFPLSHIGACLDLFRIVPDVRETEMEFSRICHRHQAIGIHNDKYLAYFFLTQREPWLLAAIESKLPKSGLVDEKGFRAKANNFHRRLNASVGRVISSREYVLARDELRKQWRALRSEVRPSLPIVTSPKTQRTKLRRSTKATQQLSDFFNAFDEFCDHWQLLGLTTWNLPNVQVPQWVPSTVPKEMREQGHMGIRTPWHFSVLGEDAIGVSAKIFHETWAAENYGVTDPGSWETYAHIFELDHWEYALSSRYSRIERVRAFVTQMEDVLAAILEISRDRIKVLRKLLKALRRGSIKSLRERR